MDLQARMLQLSFHEKIERIHSEELDRIDSAFRSIIDELNAISMKARQAMVEGRHHV